MALINCHECQKEMSDTALACPNCGAKKKRTGLPRWAWLLIVPGGLIALMMIIGSNISPEMGQFYAREKKAEEVCEKMKLGADNGSQRLLAERMCEDLKRRVQESKPGR